ncbi:winged helix-turn-helix DNA binding protein [Rahnella sp. BIGb0236]|uniref:helix-turn-helix domain-containing protein n=1 Tax=Rahnella sp. BIGb0236 TaxID=2485117 RepID=UPI0010605270|nr:helix-turn-helix domain-containing protein [Rahnella sp. BIGb0236]TDS93101.1 winged helix-turn-helix DNA binding protein [Rahnella sp. BIGb0236]
MKITPPQRPEESVSRLISALMPVSTPITVVPRKRLAWAYQGNPQFYLFLEGEVSVLRASDGLVMATAYEPLVFGIAEAMQKVHSQTLRVDTQAALRRVDAAQAMAIFSENTLWQDVAATLSYFSSYLFYRDALVVQQRTYSVIRNHLQEMILLPADTRLRISILEYIQERTHLSRSSVLNVIHALKAGDYIETSRGGYLLELTQLPEEF